MKLGIVGLPNVGKSTLFNAITNAGIPADNYAFCTIDPNVGVVAVPSAGDYSLGDRVEVMYTGEPATILTIWAEQLVDIKLLK